MIVFGSNIPVGTGVAHPNGKMEKPTWIIGVGIGLSRSDFVRVEKPEGPFKAAGDEPAEQRRG